MLFTCLCIRVWPTKLRNWHKANMQPVMLDCAACRLNRGIWLFLPLPGGTDSSSTAAVVDVKSSHSHLGSTGTSLHRHLPARLHACTHICLHDYMRAPISACVLKCVHLCNGAQLDAFPLEECCVCLSALGWYIYVSIKPLSKLALSIIDHAGCVITGSGSFSCRSAVHPLGGTAPNTMSSHYLQQVHEPTAGSNTFFPDLCWKIMHHIILHSFRVRITGHRQRGFGSATKSWAIELQQRAPFARSHDQQSRRSV